MSDDYVCRNSETIRGCLCGLIAKAKPVRVSYFFFVINLSKFSLNSVTYVFYEKRTVLFTTTTTTTTTTATATTTTKTEQQKQQQQQ